MTQEELFKKLVAHSKEYGFIFPSSEIYDGLSAVYDYGQLGVELKNNIKRYWWDAMTKLNDNIVGIDSAIFMHPRIWEASGHVGAFNDPLIDNRDSKKRYRADVLIEDFIAKQDEKIAKEVEKARKKFGDSFDEAKFLATNPRVAEHKAKRDEAQARIRRSKIQREADFFGAMDGATKFVKGDAIMSLITTLINLVGGVIVGFVTGVGDFAQIMDIYSTATVGDGLMSQIPALLISVATGMIVTRSASESNLNEDVAKQLFSQPMVLIMASIAMFMTTFIGFPKKQVIVMSVLLMALGILLQRRGSPVVQPEGAIAEGGVPAPVAEVTNEASFYKDINNVYGLLNVDQVSMEFGYSLIPLVDENSGGSFVDRVVMFRKQFAQEMGMVFPSVRLKDSGQLNPNQYAINIKGEQVAQGEVLVDHYLALIPENGEDSVDGIETVEPAFGIQAKWISEDKRVQAELAGYTLIDPTSVIITHLSEVVKAHAYELLNRQEVNNLLANLRKTNEAIVNDTVPAIVSIGSLQKILCNLLREGIPIRDTETILETLADYGATVKDIDMLTEYVRQSLRRTITHRFAEAGQLKVISLDANIENQIMGAVKKVESGSYLALDPQTIQNIITATTREIDKIKDLVQVPIILTSPIVRVYFKKLVDQFYLNTVVLSFSEIDSDAKIQALGNITI